MHGANGAGALMRPQADALLPLEVHTPDLPGHGGRPLAERFGVPAFAEDILAFLAARRIPRAVFVGYSFGGYVALYLARHFPAQTAGVCTLAAKVVYDPQTVQRFTYLADPARLSRPGNPRAAELTATHHPQDWRPITEATQRLFRDVGEHPPLTEDDLRAIRAPALVLSAADDQLVPKKESLALGRLLGCRVGLAPGQFHPFSAVPITTVAQQISAWIRESGL